MVKPQEVNDAEFDTEVIHSDLPVLVDFWGERCGPCKMLDPVLEELAVEYDGKVKFAKLNVDSNPKTIVEYEVRGIPMLLIFKGGKVVGSGIVGAYPKDVIQKRLEEALIV